MPQTTKAKPRTPYWSHCCSSILIRRIINYTAVANDALSQKRHRRTCDNCCSDWHSRRRRIEERGLWMLKLPACLRGRAVPFKNWCCCRLTPIEWDELVWNSQAHTPATGEHCRRPVSYWQLSLNLRAFFMNTSEIESNHNPGMQIRWNSKNLRAGACVQQRSEEWRVLHVGGARYRIAKQASWVANALLDVMQS